MTRTIPITSTLTLAAFLTAGWLAAPAPSQSAPANPVELGRVAWLRNYEAAAKQAKRTRKPVLLLFQEVPGWGTCQRYGAQVLSHPLIVDAAEHAFVPLCIYNNTRGDHDETVRKRFKESAWNNPVVRIIDARGRDVVSRLHSDWSLAALATTMVRALEKRKRPVPGYLESLAAEQAVRKRGLRTAVFGMGWFWVGEAQLGLIDGVVSTKSGWLARREVVEVAFDPRTLDYGDLVGKAEKARCVSPVFTRDDGQHAIAKRLVGKDAVRNDDPVRADKDTKFYLKKNLLRFVPLTGPQASRINGHLGVIGGKKGLEAATALLSPRQLELYASIREHPRAGWKSAVGRAFPEAWSEAEAIRRGLTEKRPKGRGDR